MHYDFEDFREHFIRWCGLAASDEETREYLQGFYASPSEVEWIHPRFRAALNYLETIIIDQTEDVADFLLPGPEPGIKLVSTALTWSVWELMGNVAEEEIGQHPTLDDVLAIAHSDAPDWDHVS